MAGRCLACKAAARSRWVRGGRIIAEGLLGDAQIVQRADQAGMIRAEGVLEHLQRFMEGGFRDVGLVLGEGDGTEVGDIWDGANAVVREKKAGLGGGGFRASAGFCGFSKSELGERELAA